MDPILKSKAKRLTRMIFQDVFANFHSRKELWDRLGPSDEPVFLWKIPLGESNGGTLQLICVGIETYGRVLLGHREETRVSGESFKEFICQFFPQPYHPRADQLYSRYRCGLLHSHYLGFNTAEGFFPTRDGRQLDDKHLEYGNLGGTLSSPTETAGCSRLIININTTVKDFREAVERYLRAVENKEKRTTAKGATIDLESNLATSLRDYPVDHDYQLPPNPGGSTPFFGGGGGGSVTGTTTSLPPGP